MTIRVSDYIAGELTALEVRAPLGGNTISFVIHEEFGGADESPITASITIRRSDWERIRDEVDPSRPRTPFRFHST